MKKRPVNLDLRTIKQPITAMVSILHRISGVLTVLFVPLFLWGLQYSLRSPDTFLAVQQCFGLWIVKGFVFLFVAALIYHLIAGIRHILMDFGWFENYSAGKKTGWIAIALSAAFIIGWGIFIW